MNSSWLFKNNFVIIRNSCVVNIVFQTVISLGKQMERSGHTHWSSSQVQAPGASVIYSWWGNIFVLLAICEVTCEFPSQRPVTRSFDIIFDLCLNKRLSKQPRLRWFEAPPRPFCRHCNIGKRIQITFGLCWYCATWYCYGHWLIKWYSCIHSWMLTDKKIMKFAT